jgi:hypothetical protein
VRGRDGVVTSNRNKELYFDALHTGLESGGLQIWRNCVSSNFAETLELLESQLCNIRRIQKDNVDAPFSDPKSTITGKDRNNKDDLATVLAMGLYFMLHKYADPEWRKAMETKHKIAL